MAKKHKNKKITQTRRLSIAELTEQAVEQLDLGQPGPALVLLVKAQNEIHHQRTLGKIAPAELTEQLAEVNRLSARGRFARGLAEKNPGKRADDLQEAVKRAPDEANYLVGLGACHLLAGATQPARTAFRQAQTLSPDDLLTGGAALLGAVAAGQSREGKELLRLHETADDPRFGRLTALRQLLSGNKINLAGQPSDMILSAGPLLSGLQHLAGQEPERAAAQLDALPSIARQPTRAETALLATQLFYSGVAYFQAGRFTEAVLGFDEAATLLFTHSLSELPWAERLPAYYHQLAANILAEGDLVAALACWEQALRLNPSDKIAKANLLAARETQAGKEWQRGHIAAALELWQEVLKTKQQDQDLLRNVALALEKLERPAEAIPFWRQLARLLRQEVRGKAAPRGSQQRLLHLDAHLIKLMREHNWPDLEVVREVEDALRADANNQELRRVYAETLMEVGRFPQAVKQYEALERARGASAEILVPKSLALSLAGRETAARQCLERVLEMEPGNQAARSGLAFMLSQEINLAVENQDSGRIIELCHRQLEFIPDFLPALRTLSATYLVTGREAEAEQLLQSIVARNPEDPGGHIIVGEIYLISQADKKAAAAFKRALKLDAGPEAHFDIGSVYLRVDKLKKALKHFQQAAATASVEMLIEMGGELADAEYEDEAAHYFDLAAAKDPTHPEPHLAKASLLIFARKPDEGRRELETAEQLAAGRPEFAAFLADAREMKRSIKDMERLSSMVNEIGMMPGGLAGMPPDVRQALRELGLI